MFALCCTRKLLDRMKVPTVPKPPSSTRLGDWYCNEVRVARERYIIGVSDRTLLPVVLPGRDARHLGKMLPCWVAEVLKALGVSRELVQAELDEMRESVISKTANRRVVGSLTDFASMLPSHLDAGDGIVQCAVRLAEAPCSPIGGDRPRDLAMALLSSAA
ncbi:MAG: hypothetical protein IT381_05975 [Deltaproteobacteria bacterium]|nr:hypothetical protein [Deltaproteobacteria bacterium]